MNTSNARLPDKQLWRAAIIGCGQIAGGYDSATASEGISTHAGAYRADSRVQVAAVVDVDEHRARQFAEVWHVPAWYTSAAEMLRAESPAIVSICTPDETHEDLLATCAAAGSVRAIWCEKPLGTNTARAATNVAACDEKQIILAVNYQRRWEPRLRALGVAIRAGELGSIQKVIGFYTKGIRHNGSHLVDLLTSWFGQPVFEEVFGWHNDFREDDPTVDARLVFESTTAYLVGLDERAFSLFEIDVVGTRSRVQVQDFGFRIASSQVVIDPRYPDHQMLDRASAEHETELGTCMARALDEILEAINMNGDVQSSGKTALRTLEICDRLASLAQEKQRWRN